MYDREKMVSIGYLERTKISYSLAVLLITLCVTQTSSEVNICSQELSNVQCRGRCAAAASTKVGLSIKTYTSVLTTRNSLVPSQLPYPVARPNYC